MAKKLNCVRNIDWELYVARGQLDKRLGEMKQLVKNPQLFEDGYWVKETLNALLTLHTRIDALRFAKKAFEDAR